MSDSIDDKLDSLLIKTTQLATTQAAIVTRMTEIELKRDKREAKSDEKMAKIEFRTDKFETFIDNCSLGRRVIIWLVSAIGSVVALALAAYTAFTRQ